MAKRKALLLLVAALLACAAPATANAADALIPDARFSGYIKGHLSWLIVGRTDSKSRLAVDPIYSGTCGSYRNVEVALVSHSYGTFNASGRMSSKGKGSIGVMNSATGKLFFTAHLTWRVRATIKDERNLDGSLRVYNVRLTRGGKTIARCPSKRYGFRLDSN